MRELSNYWNARCCSARPKQSTPLVQTANAFDGWGTCGSIARASGQRSTVGVKLQAKTQVSSSEAWDSHTWGVTLLLTLPNEKTESGVILTSSNFFTHLTHVKEDGGKKKSRLVSFIPLIFFKWKEKTEHKSNPLLQSHIDGQIKLDTPDKQTPLDFIYIFRVQYFSFCWYC